MAWSCRSYCIGRKRNSKRKPIKVFKTRPNLQWDAKRGKGHSLREDEQLGWHFRGAMCCKREKRGGICEGGKAPEEVRKRGGGSQRGDRSRRGESREEVREEKKGWSKPFPGGGKKKKTGAGSPKGGSVILRGKTRMFCSDARHAINSRRGEKPSLLEIGFSGRENSDQKMCSNIPP